MVSNVTFADLHCHLLAGLDDGPRTMDEAIAVCQSAATNGTSVFAATAHQLGSFRQNHRELILAAAEGLQRELLRRQHNWRVVPSAEWMVDSQWVDRLDELWPTLLTINDAGRYALVEFPYHAPPHTSLIARLLAQRGVRPVLAHVDRYPGLFTTASQVRRLRAEGFVIQLNADTVDGRRGAKMQRQASRLLTAGLIDLVASDGHDTHRRLPHLAAAYAKVCRWGGDDLGKLLFHSNPLAIMGGEAVVPAPTLGIGRRIRRWLP